MFKTFMYYKCLKQEVMFKTFKTNCFKHLATLDLQRFWACARSQKPRNSAAFLPYISMYISTMITYLNWNEIFEFHSLLLLVNHSTHVSRTRREVRVWVSADRWKYVRRHSTCVERKRTLSRRATSAVWVGLEPRPKKVLRRQIINTDETH